MSFFFKELLSNQSFLVFFYKCRMDFEKQRERRLVLGVHHTAHVCMFICLLCDVVCLCRPHSPGTLCSPRWPQTHVPALLLSLPRAGIAGMQCCASLFCSFKTRLFLHQLVISQKEQVLWFFFLITCFWSRNSSKLILCSSLALSLPLISVLKWCPCPAGASLSVHCVDDLLSTVLFQSAGFCNFSF